MYDMLFTYAKCLLESPALAEEAVQETFRIACVKPEALAESENPRGWITNTMKNVVRNMKRSYASLARLVVQSLSAEEQIMQGSAADNYTDIEYSDLIVPDEYELLKSIVLEKNSIRDAARERGISVEACRKRVQRAKQKLQKALAAAQ